MTMLTAILCAMALSLMLWLIMAGGSGGDSDE